MGLEPPPIGERNVSECVNICYFQQKIPKKDLSLVGKVYPLPTPHPPWRLHPLHSKILGTPLSAFSDIFLIVALFSFDVTFTIKY